MEDFYFRQDPHSDNDNENEEENYDPEIELSNIEEQLKKLWNGVLYPYLSNNNSKEILHKVQENDFHFLWSFFLDNNKTGKKILREIRKN